jgi:hypothetical protein
MGKPNRPEIWPKGQPPNVFPTVFPAGEAVNFDADAFDQAITSQGLTVVHWRAMRCPLGVIDPDDQRKPHGEHGDCSNGFIYKVVGPVTALFTNNSNQNQLLDMGVIDQATVNVTFPRFYDIPVDCCSDNRVLVVPYDRLYLAEETITVINWQLFELSGGDTEKLNYPLVEVEHLLDNRGNEYRMGTDFDLFNGLLRWLPQGQRPPPNADIGRNGVASIRYRYRPYWYVKNMGHEIRATQFENQFTGERTTQRMQQMVQAQREYVFENELNDPEAKDIQSQDVVNPDGSQPPESPLTKLEKAQGSSNLRHTLAPRNGSFGPR